jgi:Uncharacterised protein family (UPF0259)
MSSPKCVVCGHINRVGAALCEMCDARLPASGASETGRGDGPHADTSYARGGEPWGGDALPTDIPAPLFQGAGDVIAPTLEVYRKHFPLIGLLVLATSLPLVLLQYGAYLLLTPGMDGAVVNVGTDAGLLGLVTGGALLSSLVAMLGNALLSGALVYGVIELRRTGGAKAGDCLRWGVRKLPKVFLVQLFFTIVTTAGFILLIVPGIILSLIYAVAAPVAAAEDRGVFDSFRRSAELTRGYRGLIFLTYFLWWLLIFVVSIIVTGSFAFGGVSDSFAVLFFRTLVEQMLQSSSIVLTVFIFLGLRREAEHGFDHHVVTPASHAGGGAAAR